MSSPPMPAAPEVHWLLGNLPEFRRDLLGFVTRCASDYGDFVPLRLGPRQVILLSDPEGIDQVLSGSNRLFVKHYVMRFLHPLLGNGLLTSEGKLWLRQRRLIQPAFLRQRIESYGAVMVAHTEQMLAEWRDGETRDLHAEMMYLALGIVSKAILDVEAGDTATEVG